MNRILWVATVLLIGSIYISPSVMLSPGELIEKHKKAEEKCSNCHKAAEEVQGKVCITCHKISDISVERTQAGRSFSHNQLSKNSCTQCHSDHLGRSFSGTFRFLHKELKNDKACVDCHKKPDNKIHLILEPNCKSCHGTEKWTPASIDHKQWFVFDRYHRPKCETCHIEQNYSEYSCTECHEHSQRKLEKEHREEGIGSFQNCVKCHRDGKEDSANWYKRSIKNSTNNIWQTNKEDREEEEEDDD